MSQLHVENVTLTFGGLNALSGVTLSVPEGEVVSIIGPNGAGKTSLLNCISGFYHPTQGRITYGEHDLSRAAPNVVTGFGIARAFQNLELFRGLNVVENLLLARHTHLKYSLLDSLLYYGRASRREAENRAYVERIIDFMELEEHRAHPVGTLGYGIQKRVGRR